jgi:hypothetical protein
MEIRVSLAEARGAETLLLAREHDTIREMAGRRCGNPGNRMLSAMDGEASPRIWSTPRSAKAPSNLSQVARELLDQLKTASPSETTAVIDFSRNRLLFS